MKPSKENRRSKRKGEKNKINMAKKSMKTGNNIPLFMLS